jgi:hypothetical protein
VHLPERFSDELEAGTIGVTQVHPGPALPLVFHCGLIEVPLQPRPSFGLHADGQVLQPAKHLDVSSQCESWHVQDR